MTLARTASNGLVTPPPLHRWMEAVLMLCVSLVQGAATKLKMIFNRRPHDWHTGDAYEALPQATSGIQSQEAHTTQHTHQALMVSSAAMAARPSNHEGVTAHTRIVATPTKSFSGSTREPFFTALAWQKDARVTPEHDTVGVPASDMEADKVRVPRDGRGPVLRAAQNRARNIA